MLVKILGTIDMIAAVILFLLAVRIPFPAEIVLFIGIIVILKSFIGLFKELGGWIDLACGLFIILGLILPVPMLVLFAFAFLIFQKGIVSFL